MTCWRGRGGGAARSLGPPIHLVIFVYALTAFGERKRCPLGCLEADDITHRGVSEPVRLKFFSVLIWKSVLPH